MDDFVRSLTLDFLGGGGHKVLPDALFSDPSAVLLDVRTREEVQSVCFPLENQVSISLQIPLNELPDRLVEIPRDRLVGILCVTDVRSAIAYAYLQTHGLDNVRVLAGGTAGLLEQLKTGNVRRHVLARGTERCRCSLPEEPGA